MTVALTRLLGFPELRRSAELLARTRHLHLQLADAGGAPEGFRRGAAALDLWTRTDAEPPRAVEGELARRLDDGLELAISDVGTFGVERLIEAIYVPLFVRHAFCTREASFPMNLEVFRRLATPDVLLTIAAQGGVERAAMLLQPCRRTPAQRYSEEALLPRGLDIVALATAEPGFGDAFFHASLRMLEASGWGSVRLRKTPWVTSESAGVWWRDLGRAERVAWEEREPADFFFAQPAALAGGEGVIGFECEPGGLRPWRVGAQHPLLREVERRLGALLRQAESRVQNRVENGA